VGFGEIPAHGARTARLGPQPRDHDDVRHAIFAFSRLCALAILSTHEAE
jgi:hypothetical protein